MTDFRTFLMACRTLCYTYLLSTITFFTLTNLEPRQGLCWSGPGAFVLRLWGPLGTNGDCLVSCRTDSRTPWSVTTPIYVYLTKPHMVNQYENEQFDKAEEDLLPIPSISVRVRPHYIRHYGDYIFKKHQE